MKRCILKVFEKLATMRLLLGKFRQEFTWRMLNEEIWVPVNETAGLKEIYRMLVLLNFVTRGCDTARGNRWL